MKKYKIKLSNFLPYFFAISLPLVSFAQIQNPLGGVSDIPSFVARILGYVVRVGGIIAIFAFIYAGFRFVQARGNPTELKTAREIFKNTVIGVAILLGAQIIASIIVGTIKTLQ